MTAAALATGSCATLSQIVQPPQFTVAPGRDAQLVGPLPPVALLKRADQLAEHEGVRLRDQLLVRADAHGLVQEHAVDLPSFLTSDPKGRKLPDYLATLGGELVGAVARPAQEDAEAAAGPGDDVPTEFLRMIRRNS